MEEAIKSTEVRELIEGTRKQTKIWNYPISAVEWYDDFSALYCQKIPAGVKQKRGFWGKWVLDVLKELGEEKGFIVEREELRIDMSWYKPGHYDPEVVIEYEWVGSDVLREEVPKLTQSNARLKVLITYVVEEEINDLLEKIYEIWSNRNLRVWNDELLVVFVVWHAERDSYVFDYLEAHRLYPSIDKCRDGFTKEAIHHERLERIPLD